MNPDFLSKLSDVTVIAALLTALVGGAAIVWQTWYQKAKATRTVWDALFAELTHIEKHYSITASDIEIRATKSTEPLRLAWAKYGKVQAAEHLKDFAALGSTEMAALLQLSFVIRNTDLLLDELARPETIVSRADVDYLVARMRFSATTARSLMEYMARKESRYAQLLQAAANIVQGYV